MDIATQTRNFRRYNHVERLGHDKVASIEFGTVHVFPKLDGTNASVWCGEDGIQAGSRNRTLSIEKDNGGFLAWALSEDEKAQAVRKFCEDNPNYILYGEWLIPHTLKTYRDSAWRRFWVFDVYNRDTNKYLPWNEYKALLEPLGVDLIEPLCTIIDPTKTQLEKQTELNTYLVKENEGTGEGVVFKNYDWCNYEHSQPWAKVVRNDFKEANQRAFGTTEKHGEIQVEQKMVETYLTSEFALKTYAKVLLRVADEVGISTKEDDWQSRVANTYRGRVIPMLLGTINHDFIHECLWDCLKAYKNPTVDFRLLGRRMAAHVKTIIPDLFS